MKLPAAILTLSLLGTAPFQCSTHDDPNHRTEDTPAEALWGLSERFRAEGNDAARRTTLEQLVERYPSSREANRARMVLEGREVAPDEPEEPEPANEQAEAVTGTASES